MLKEIVLTDAKAGMRYVIQGHVVIVEFSDDGGKAWKHQVNLALSDLRAVVAAAGPDETHRPA